MPTCECDLCGYLLDDDSKRSVELFEPEYMQDPKSKRITANSVLCQICYYVAMLRAARHYLSKTIDKLLDMDPDDWGTTTENDMAMTVDSTLGYICEVFPNFHAEYLPNKVPAR